MAFWIGVAHARQVAIAREGGFVAFSHGREAAARRLSPGDRVIWYAPRDEFEGAPVQAFVAHATVTGETPVQKHYGDRGLEGWTRDAAYDEVTEVPVRPLLDALSFVADPAHWGMAFRRGQFEIPGEDYRLIAGRMLEGAPCSG
ncbi:EVE domain-containing protein [Rhodobacterales bacterium HKCCE2091]|nr:EVE domain-containing protein [Rhodobacterales bacterium HKCCE2091]